MDRNGYYEKAWNIHGSRRLWISSEGVSANFWSHGDRHGGMETANSKRPIGWKVALGVAFLYLASCGTLDGSTVESQHKLEWHFIL